MNVIATEERKLSNKNTKVVLQDFSKYNIGKKYWETLYQLSDNYHCKI